MSFINTLISGNNGGLKLGGMTPMQKITNLPPSNRISLPKVILCPCCNMQMTPNHECLNKSLSEPESTNSRVTLPQAPCPVEPTTHPPDTNVNVRDRGGLMNDPDFDRRMAEFCDATISSPDCKTQ